MFMKKKHLYIIIAGWFLTNCQAPPLPPAKNDWQKMDLKGRVKYCFYEIISKDGSKQETSLYDTVYHFSQEGLLAYSKIINHNFHNCTSQIPILFNKYQYYPDGKLKAAYVYLEYHNDKKPNIKEFSMLYDIEFYSYQNNTTKIHHLGQRYIENYNQSGQIMEKVEYDSHSQRIYLFYWLYDSLNSLRRKEEYSIRSKYTSHIVSEYNNDILQKERHYLRCDTCNSQTIVFQTVLLGEQPYSMLDYLHKNEDTSYKTSVPLELYKKKKISYKCSYKYDQYGNWVERNCGTITKRKIEYW